MRVIALAALALAGCGARDEPQPKAPAPAEAVFILHWKDGADDYSREYPTMPRCQLARKAILDDNVSRSRTNHEVAKDYGAPSQPDSFPIPICIPT